MHFICEGKQAFATKAAALRVFSRKVARHGFRNTDRTKSAVYRCPACNTFHIGSQPVLITPRKRS